MKLLMLMLWVCFSPLPESPTNDTYSVCMFVKDITSKTERDFSQTVDHFKEKLEKCGMVNVPQVGVNHSQQWRYMYKKSDNM